MWCRHRVTSRQGILTLDSLTTIIVETVGLYSRHFPHQRTPRKRKYYCYRCESVELSARSVTSRCNLKSNGNSDLAS